MFSSCAIFIISPGQLTFRPNQTIDKTAKPNQLQQHRTFRPNQTRDKTAKPNQRQQHQKFRPNQTRDKTAKPNLLQQHRKFIPTKPEQFADGKKGQNLICSKETNLPNQTVRSHSRRKCQTKSDLVTGDMPTKPNQMQLLQTLMQSQAGFCNLIYLLPTVNPAELY